ncbi:MAG: hypothetical protein AB1715_10525, partial [Acidobacteriota bacterium]
AVREFRRTSDELRGRIEEEIQASEYKEIKEELKRDLQEGAEETRAGELKEDREEPKKDSPKDEEGQKVS